LAFISSLIGNRFAVLPKFLLVAIAYSYLNSYF